MIDRPALGTIRILAGGAVFDFPYYDEEAFDRQVDAIRRDGYFCSPKVFIPLQQIVILKLPNEAVDTMQVQREARGKLGSEDRAKRASRSAAE